MADLTGRQLGQYEIVRKIGAGGMATVYLARQLNVNRDVAIKVIESRYADDTQFVQRFRREAQTIAALNHPHILKLFDFGDAEGVLYLVMELQTGGSLAELIHRESIRPDYASRLVEQIAAALDYAHGRGIVHRDLKPQNVLLDEGGNAILTDFGIARLMGSNLPALTATGAAMGTPAYMAPEMWQGQPVDARVDIYALGIMVYELFTGRLPFSGDTPASIMYAHLQQTPPSVRTSRPEISPAVETVINRALAKDKDKRYGSAGEMATALRIAVLTPTPQGTPKAMPVADLDATGPALDKGTFLAPSRGTPSRGMGTVPLVTEAPANRRSNTGLLIGAAVVMVVLLGLAVILLAGRGGTPTETLTSTVTAVAQAATQTLIPTVTQTAIPPTETTLPTETPSPDPREVAATLRAQFLTETAAPSATLTPSVTPSPDVTGTVQAQLTAFSLDDLTSTATRFTRTPTPSKTLTRTATATHTVTATATKTFTATRTPTATITPTTTRTPTATATATKTATPTVTSSATPRPTLTLTATRTPVPLVVITVAIPTATNVPPTWTPIPPTWTPALPTATEVPPTWTPALPTWTPVWPTATEVPPTWTPVLPTWTPALPTPTATEVLPTWTPVPPTAIAANANSIPTVTADTQASWQPIIRSFNGVEMVLVPPGCFQMGSANGNRNERPVHEVCFTEPFWLDRFEVTNAQFSELGGKARFTSANAAPDQPRDRIGWTESFTFCTQARDARLPSEAEWEYAGRGPAALIFPWGNEFDSSKAVWQQNARGKSAPVGSKPEGASWVGAQDLSGNVWEWVNTFLRGYPYSATDGREDTSIRTVPRVARGDSYLAADAFQLRMTLRASNVVTAANPNHGFRCARDFSPADLSN